MPGSGPQRQVRALLSSKPATPYERDLLARAGVAVSDASLAVLRVSHLAGWDDALDIAEQRRTSEPRHPSNRKRRSAPTPMVDNDAQSA